MSYDDWKVTGFFKKLSMQQNKVSICDTLNSHNKKTGEVLDLAGKYSNSLMINQY